MESINPLKKRLFELGFSDVILIDETASTNDDAKEYARASSKRDVVIVANRQTAGRGRQSKSYYSPDGGVYLSVIVKNEDLWWTGIAAVAVSKTLFEYNIQNTIKWVNDIFVGDKKCAGILCESVDYAVIIGIGVNTTKETNLCFTNELSDIATKIQIKDKDDFIASLLQNLLDGIKNFDKKDIFEYYKTHFYLDGKNVLISDINGEYTAKIVGIDKNLSLIVKKDDQILPIKSGVVSIKVL